MGTEYTTKLYFECHVTIDPVFDERRAIASAIAQCYKFKLAKLIMEKGGELKQSELDTFMTGHGQDYKDLEERMVSLIEHLNRGGMFKVRRYKIENTLLDSRPQGDPLKLLNKPDVETIE